MQVLDRYIRTNRNDESYWKADRTNDPRIRQIRPAEEHYWCNVGYEAIRTVDALPEWMTKAIEADKQGRIPKSIDIVFDNMESLLSGGDFDTVDAILRLLPADGISLTFLMSLLSITLPASRELASRGAIFARAWQLAIKSKKNAKQLLGGLEHWSSINGAGALNRR